jgi:hypothetical protein
VLNPKQHKRSSNLIAAAAIILLVWAITDAVRQTHVKGIKNPNDFVTLYAGSICLTHGCNPYNVPDLNATLVDKRGNEIQQDWSDQLPIYPPTTLILLLPLSLLSYKSAMTVWYLGSLLLYASGLCWLYFISIVRTYASLPVRVIVVLLGLHFPRMLQCLSFGNPSLIVTGLLMFSVFDDAESRRSLRYIAMGLACLLKPPLALPLAVVMLLRERKDLRSGWIFAAALGAVGFAMGLIATLPKRMAHWRLDLGSNIALGEQMRMNPSLRSSASNSILNVANLPGYFTTNSTTIRVVSMIIVAVLGVCFLLLVRRERRSGAWESRGYLLAAATMAAITLLPVYHRFCDIGVLLIVVPWLLWELSKGPSWQSWTISTSVLLLMLLYFSWERRINLNLFHGKSLAIMQFLYYRGDPLLVLLLACVLLSAMYASNCHPLAASASQSEGVRG